MTPPFHVVFFHHQISKFSEGGGMPHNPTRVIEVLDLSLGLLFSSEVSHKRVTTLYHKSKIAFHKTNEQKSF